MSVINNVLSGVNSAGVAIGLMAHGTAVEDMGTVHMIPICPLGETITHPFNTDQVPSSWHENCLFLTTVQSSYLWEVC